MSNFEKKFGRYAIRNLSLMLILCYAAGYILQLISSDFLYFLTLDPYQILHGQIWRIFTWILVPPDTLSIFTLITLYFYYSLGTALEHTMGTYRYNVYLFTGMGFMVIAGFLAYAGCYIFYGPYFADAAQAKLLFSQCSVLFSTYYINMSIFLTFAVIYPNAQVLLMFVIPVKVKWIGILDGLLIAYELIRGVGVSGDLGGILNLFYRLAIIAALLNFLLFWWRIKKRVHLAPKQIKRRQEFRSQVRHNSGPATHKCAVCGQTDADNPDLEFRYCSKCNGNYEYCQNHLFTHEHVR